MSDFARDPRFPSFQLTYYNQVPQPSADPTPFPLESNVLQYNVPDSQRRNAQSGQPLTDGEFALYPHVPKHRGRSTSIKGEFITPDGDSQEVYAIATGPGLVKSVWAAVRHRRDQLTARVDVTIATSHDSTPDA